MSIETEPLERTVKVSELFDYMRANDLVITHRSVAEEDNLKERYLRKKSLTYKEISDAKIWGSIGKKAVELIAKKQVQEHAIFSKGNAFRIMRSEVERIARNRGTL